MALKGHGRKALNTIIMSGQIGANLFAPQPLRYWVGMRRRHAFSRAIIYRIQMHPPRWYLRCSLSLRGPAILRGRGVLWGRGKVICCWGGIGSNEFSRCSAFFYLGAEFNYN